MLVVACCGAAALLALLRLGPRDEIPRAAPPLASGSESGQRVARVSAPTGHRVAARSVKGGAESHRPGPAGRSTIQGKTLKKLNVYQLIDLFVRARPNEAEAWLILDQIGSVCRTGQARSAGRFLAGLVRDSGVPDRVRGKALFELAMLTAKHEKLRREHDDLSSLLRPLALKLLRETVGPETLAAAAFAAGQLGETAAFHALERIAELPHTAKYEKAIRSALLAMEQLGQRRATDCAARLARKTPNLNVFRTAALVVGRGGGPRAVRMLIEIGPRFPGTHIVSAMLHECSASIHAMLQGNNKADVLSGIQAVATMDGVDLHSGLLKAVVAHAASPSAEIRDAAVKCVLDILEHYSPEQARAMLRRVWKLTRGRQLTKSVAHRLEELMRWG
ncbi:MAG: hypothetical protein D6724_03220 [Armatimonadetes bacterium]|nr:MAG: hypothetical protein D6724_03220 [Armatimonadota bacterium]